MTLYESLLGHFVGRFNTTQFIKKQIAENVWEEKVIPPEDLLKAFCVSTVSRNVFLWKYKTMPQLSEMDAEEKQKLKVYVNELFKGETPQFRLEACKVIFTLNNCL